jgi:hypothetical protein
MIKERAVDDEGMNERDWTPDKEKENDPAELQKRILAMAEKTFAKGEAFLGGGVPAYASIPYAPPSSAVVETIRNGFLVVSPQNMQNMGSQLLADSVYCQTLEDVLVELRRRFKSDCPEPKPRV